jgi:hypothetical protein
MTEVSVAVAKIEDHPSLVIVTKDKDSHCAMSDKDIYGSIFITGQEQTFNGSFLNSIVRVLKKVCEASTTETETEIKFIATGDEVVFKSTPGTCEITKGTSGTPGTRVVYTGTEKIFKEESYKVTAPVFTGGSVQTSKTRSKRRRNKKTVKSHP